MREASRLLVYLIVLCSSLWLAACGGSSSGSGNNSASGGSEPGDVSQGRVFFIQPGPDATTDMVLAMIEAKPKDVIEFAEGYFELTSGIQISGTENILVKGQGMDKTILSFKNSGSQEGFLATTVRGITVEDLTVLDSPGDAFKLQGVDHGTLRRVRAFWSSGRNLANEDTVTAENYKTKLKVACTDPARHNPDNPNPLETDTSSPDYNVSKLSGRYGIYPVNSQNILVDGAEAIGASDAGIYVGQTDNAIIQNSRAAFNVFGFEIENVRGGEYVNNLSECNTGGFLVYDLDGLTRYGSRTRVYKNTSRNNNTYNFAEPGSIVSNVPRGTGMLTMGYDKIDIFDNVFEDNGTAGIVHTSYKLFGVPGDRRLDLYSEGVHIWNNEFRNNGNDIPMPDFAAIVETGGEQVTSAFPMLVGLKMLAGAGEYRGAHIVWDGYLDEYDADCPYPTDDKGQPVPADAEGKPVSGNQYPNPSCRYNAYKFNDAGERLKPLWWSSCIDDSNRFDSDSMTFANFDGTEGLEALLYLPPEDQDDLVDIVTSLPNFAADTDITPHRCEDQYGSNMPLLPPIVIPEFEPSGTIDPAPSDELVESLCNQSVASGKINASAYKVNCPRLDQYNLFSDKEDPTSLPNGRGIPFVLNTKLFSDYSTKFRVAYLPEGTQAIYRDGNDSANATILFPLGTILAKTFSFTDEPSGKETPVETRLIIKRQTSSGQYYWDALEYKWGVEGGEKVARLAQQGDVVSASWDYHDVNSGEHYQGSTDEYVLPNANQCQSCHANDDAETGAAPIGPKVRNLNRPFKSESPLTTGIDNHPVNGVNQIVYWCQNGLMKNCPENMETDSSQHVSAVERNPIFNVPGDSGYDAGSDEDIEARVRSYLEVNCAHCHNPRGLAQNTGFYLDVFRKVNDTFGICKGPTASGTEGRGGREYDIVPGNAQESILPYRLGPEADTLAARMPPIARSTVHGAAFDLVTQWINDVVDDSYDNADACGENNDSGSLPMCLPDEIPVLGGQCLPL
ncbi:parallel beta-helix domain-containing protein [Spongiibacter sp. UBA1325]|uniref:parallel beta-helix domain-containing protein n=1 Tax=Spongiibacter sp. UBA1325 TaxID=1947543 RepID=UPI00257FE640|nr:parallel beta-helix domain-containing protein [Spongiibacter sp. UBA1325]